MNVAQKFVRDFEWWASGTVQDLAASEEGPTSPWDYMLILDALRSAQGFCVTNRPQRKFGIACDKDGEAREWQALDILARELYREAEQG